jgi:hypothetical protein
MKAHRSHPDPQICWCLVFEPNRLEQAALEAAYQHLVPQVRRATAVVTPARARETITPVLRRERA